jgi:hypothetical protein
VVGFDVVCYVSVCRVLCEFLSGGVYVIVCTRRRIACPGICIEGHCSSKPKDMSDYFSGCEASGHMVVSPQSFGEFDVRFSPCHCPLCSAKLTPETCGFTNCWWRFVGRKADGSVHESAWEYVGDEYKRFDEVCVEGPKATTHSAPNPGSD